MAHTADIPFSSILNNLIRIDECSHSIIIPESWMQGRTSYGGLTAALCLEAALKGHEELPPLRSAHFTFISPTSGTPTIRTNNLRQGKSMTFLGASMLSGNEICATSVLAFGKSRESSGFNHITAPVVQSPEDCPDFFVWDNMPVFMQNFVGRHAGGSTPCSGSDNAMMTVWLRHKNHQGKLGLPGILAIVDALPPAIFPLLLEPTPISTISWSIDFFGAQQEQYGEWILLESRAESLGSGYSTQNIMAWNQNGEPIVSCRQNVAIF